MKKSSYRDGKIPGRKGYGIDDAELVRLFESKLEFAEIARSMKISLWTVLKHLKKLGLRRTQRHPIGRPDAFSILVANSCYWAGFLAADGFVLSGRNGIGVELAIKDETHLKNLCHFVGRNDTLVSRTRHKNGKDFQHVEVGLISSELMDDLARNFNIVPRKSLILEPPDLPEKMRRHFIRGYFDGDGSVGWHKCSKTIRLNFCSGSEAFLKWIWNTLCETLGDVGQRTIGRRKRSKVRTLDLSGDAAIKVLEWMYSDGGDALCLRRKLDKFCECRDMLEQKRTSRLEDRQAFVDLLTDLYAAGLSYREIADKLGTSIEKVSYYMRKTTIPKRGKTDGSYGRHIRERDASMLSAYLSGETADSLASRFGICKSSVWAALNRTKNNGISKNTQST
jgi:DNA-binding CsgD family transcriptional regulator